MTETASKTMGETKIDAREGLEERYERREDTERQSGQGSRTLLIRSALLTDQF